ncbi:MAG: hypothetical protein ACRCY3_12855 [Sphingorhabdus sp.]
MTYRRMQFAKPLVGFSMTMAILSACGRGPTDNGTTSQDQLSHRGPPSEKFKNVMILGKGSDPAPDGLFSGRFVEDGNCLLFETTTGGRHNPVFAGSASINRDGDALVIEIGNNLAQAGELIRVGGGSSADIKELTPAQRSCAQSIFIIGAVIDEKS